MNFYRIFETISEIRFIQPILHLEWWWIFVGHSVSSYLEPKQVVKYVTKKPFGWYSPRFEGSKL